MSHSSPPSTHARRVEPDLLTPFPGQSQSRAWGAASGLSGAKIWLAGPVLGLLAWRLISPWVVIIPMLIAAAALIAVYVLRRPTTAAPRADGRGPYRPGPAFQVSRAGYGMTCLGCRTTRAVFVLAVDGHRIPVCDPCRRLALHRIATGHVQLPR